MASPTVQNTNTSQLSTAGTSHTVNLPSGIQSGDLLLIFFSFAITGQTITWPNGWTQFFFAEQTSGGSDGLAGAYRQADGTEGASVSVTTSVAAKSAHNTYRITGHANPSTQAPEAATAIGTNANADPPSLSPTGGAKDYLWLAVGGNVGPTNYTGYPASYTGGITVASSGGAVNTNTKTGSASRQWNAASDDPGAFSGGDEGAVSEWVGATVAVHPAGEAPLIGIAFIDESYEEEPPVYDWLFWQMPADVLPPEEMPFPEWTPIDETYDIEHLDHYIGWQIAPLSEDFIEPQIPQAEYPAIDEAYDEEHDYAGLTIWQVPENVEDFQPLAEWPQVDEFYDEEHSYVGWLAWLTPDDIIEPYILPEATQIDESYDDEHEYIGWQAWATPEDIQDFQALPEFAQVDEGYEPEYDYAGWQNWVMPDDISTSLPFMELAQVDETYEQPYEIVDTFGWQARITPENVEEPGIWPEFPVVDQAYDQVYEYDGWQGWQTPTDVITVIHPNDLAPVWWRDKRAELSYQEKRAVVDWRDRRKTNE